MNFIDSTVLSLTPENGLVMYIWLGSQVNPTFVQSLFGVQTGHIQPEKVIAIILISVNHRMSLVSCHRA